jgi:hypothetical protein
MFDLPALAVYLAPTGLPPKFLPDHHPLNIVAKGGA